MQNDKCKFEMSVNRVAQFHASTSQHLNISNLKSEIHTFVGVQALACDRAPTSSLVNPCSSIVIQKRTRMESLKNQLRRIMSAFAKRMASQQSPNTLCAPLHCAVLLNGDDKVLAATWREPAIRSEHGTDRVLIKTHHPDENSRRKLNQ